MKFVLFERGSIRRHLWTGIGVAFCLYFSYHLIYGGRSWAQMSELEGRILATQTKLDETTERREKLERRVSMMRPGSLDRDLLEEEAAATVGYRQADERILLTDPDADTQ